MQFPGPAVEGALITNSATEAEPPPANLDTLNNRSVYNRGEQGVFAEYPFSTPKYARNQGGRDNEFKESLARFYISLAGGGVNGKEAIQAYLDSVPPEAKPLAKVLVGAQGKGGGSGFIDFFLTQVVESFAETAQVEKVLSDNYVAFFFGSEPPQFQYSGVLLNSIQDDHRIGMAIAYQHLIRGTKLAQRGALLRVRYDDVIVSGAVMNMSQTLNAENELAVPFNFTLLVKEYLVIRVPARVTAKVETPFAKSKLLGNIGTAQDTRSRIVLAPTKQSQTSTAGDDEAAPETAQTPEEKTAAAEAAAAAADAEALAALTDVKYTPPLPYYALPETYTPPVPFYQLVTGG